MLLDLMAGFPGPITHGTTMTSSSDVITFWVIVGIVAALVLVAMIVGVVSYRLNIQWQSQMKETEWSYEAFPQPQGEEQPPVQAPEEEKVLLRR